MGTRGRRTPERPAPGCARQQQRERLGPRRPRLPDRVDCAHTRVRLVATQGHLPSPSAHPILFVRIRAEKAQGGARLFTRPRRRAVVWSSPFVCAGTAGSGVPQSRTQSGRSLRRLGRERDRRLTPRREWCRFIPNRSQSPHRIPHSLRPPWCCLTASCHRSAASRAGTPLRGRRGTTRAPPPRALESRGGHGSSGPRSSFVVRSAPHFRFSCAA